MRKMNRKWQMNVLGVLGALAVASGALAQQAVETPAAPADSALLAAVPEDAAGFLAIRSLSELDRDIQAISAQVGFPLGPQGMFPAPLEWMKMSLQMTEGLREDGGAALVLLSAREVKNVEEIPDHLVLYIPATDPKALLASMGGEEGTDGLYQLNLGGSPSVATTREGFVLVAKAPEAPGAEAPAALAAAARARGEGVIKSMAPDRVQAFGRQDLFLWVNFRNMSDDMRKQITDGVREFFGQFEQGFQGGRQIAGGDAAGTQPGAAQDSAGQTAVNQVEKFLTQGEQVSLGLSLDARVGLSLSAYSRVRPDTELARMIAAKPASEVPLLTGLPDEDFIVAGGMVVGTTPESLREMRRTAENLARRVAEMDKDPGSPLTPENLKPLIDIWINMLQNTQRVSVSLTKLSDAQSADSLVGLAMVANVKDAQAWRRQVREGFTRIKELAAGVAKADGAEQEKVDQIAGAFVWQENAAEVSGASVDVLRVELESIPDVTPEQVGQVKAIAGPEGIVVRVATIGDDQVAVSFGGGEERLAKIIGLARDKQAPLAKRQALATVAERMPDGNRVAVGYISLAALLETIDAASARLDSPLPVRLTLANAAPIAFSGINVDEHAQQMDLLIPSELIVSTANMVREQLLPMFMMGGMGGGPGMEQPEEQEFDAPRPRPRPQPQEQE